MKVGACITRIVQYIKIPIQAKNPNTPQTLLLLITLFFVNIYLNQFILY